MAGMEVVGAAGQPQQAQQAEQAEQYPSVIRRAYDALVCWWVLVRARLVRTEKSNPEVEHCLQLQKGTRFQLRGGEVHCIDSESRRAEATVSSGRSGNDE